MIFPSFALAERGRSLLPSGLGFKGWTVHPHTTPTLPEIQGRRWPGSSSPTAWLACPTWALAAHQELLHLRSSPSPRKQQSGCPGNPGTMVGPGAATDLVQLLPPHSWNGKEKWVSKGSTGWGSLLYKVFPSMSCAILSSSRFSIGKVGLIRPAVDWVAPWGAHCHPKENRNLAGSRFYPRSPGMDTRLFYKAPRVKGWERMATLPSFFCVFWKFWAFGNCTNGHSSRKKRENTCRCK